MSASVWDGVVSTLENIAPMIATALGTPIAGTAVAALEQVFGLTPAPGTSMQDRQAAVGSAMQCATPDQLAACRKADQDYAVAMAQAGFKDKETLAQLAQQEETAYLGDIEDARRANAANERVFALGVVILATFAGMILAALWGSYAILTGKLPVENAAVVGMVSGFVGTLIGYAAANASQVVSFYYGSSKQGEANASAMASAFQQTFAGVGKKPTPPTK
jgi:hypothetical protein